MTDKRKWIISECVEDFLVVPALLVILRPIFEQSSGRLLITAYAGYLVAMMVLMVAAYRVRRGNGELYRFLTNVSTVAWPTVLTVSLFVAGVHRRRDLLIVSAAYTLIGVFIKAEQHRREHHASGS